MILGVDLSDSSLSLSLRQHQQEIILFKKQLNHMELSPSILQHLLQKERINLSALERLALISGPGNYTGLRASILLIRSIALQFQLPVWHLTRLEAVLFGCQGLAAPVWVSQSVRMNQYYFGKGHYRAESGFCFEVIPQTGNADALIAAWTKSPSLFIGDWTDQLQAPFLPMILPVSALTLWCEKTAIQGSDWREIKPFYIRPAVNPTHGQAVEQSRS